MVTIWGTFHYAPITTPSSILIQDSQRNSVHISSAKEAKPRFRQGLKEIHEAYRILNKELLAISLWKDLGPKRGLDSNLDNYLNTAFHFAFVNEAGSDNRILSFRSYENTFILPSFIHSPFLFGRSTEKNRNTCCLGKLHWHNKSMRFSMEPRWGKDSCSLFTQTCMFLKRKLCINRPK